MLKVIFIRHGKTLWNSSGRFQGQSNTKLAAEGIAQAEKLAENFPVEHIDTVYSSPLERAFITGKIIADKFHVPITADERLCEISFGAWEGLTYDEIHAKWPAEIEMLFSRPDETVIPQGEKFSALLYIDSINGYPPYEAQKRKNFEDLTPIFPNKRIRLETPGCTTAMRIVDLVSPIGKGQRGMIVSPPKAGKTTLLKEVALSVQKTEPNMHLLILLIDERPEEVTDIREAIAGPNVEVIYSTFDELPDHHKRVSEMVIARAKRLVEHGKDVMILLDSITRLARAYNLTVPPSGRTLSGGLDPAALYSPKRFFGAARNMREGGSLTILATALVETGSKMDDVVYEEFKGTGNMELMLDRKLQEKRVFPAIDIPKSGTRREDLLLDKDEQEAAYIIRRAMNGMKAEEAVDNLLNMFSRTKSNSELVHQVIRQKFI